MSSSSNDVVTLVHSFGTEPPENASCPPARGALLSLLTPRERQVVHYVADGRANKVIAIDLGISSRTAEAHRARIFQKLGVRNAMQLACKLCEYGPAASPGLCRDRTTPFPVNRAADESEQS